jgi:acyl-CoA synthetase (AMP-forming)/AMP-acid ligase II
MTLYTNSFIKILSENKSVAPFLFYDNKTLSNETLLIKSTQLALRLSKKGFNKKSKVVLLIPTNIEFVILFYALMMIGSQIVIIDPQMGEMNFKEKLKFINPDFAIVDSRIIFLKQHILLNHIVKLLKYKIPYWSNLEFTKVYLTGLKLPILGKYAYIDFNYESHTPIVTFDKIEDDHPLLITFTSGTTDSPKGVVHTYTSLTESMQLLGKIMKQHSISSIATHLPHYALLGIISGIKVHIWNEEWSTKKKIDFLSKHKIEALFGPPSDFIPYIKFLSAHQDYKEKLNHLRHLFLGSAPVYNSFLEKLSHTLPKLNTTILYGMTEHLMISSIDGIVKLNEIADKDNVGVPFPGVEVRINEDEELEIKSKQLFSEYYLLSKADEWHKTGDLASIKNNNIYLMGRKKDMIIRKNFNIYPSLYEPIIDRIPGVNKAVMIGLYDHNKEDEVVFLCVEINKYISVNTLRNLLEKGPYSIDKDALPDHIVFMPIPVIGRHMKINKKELMAQLTKS